VAYDYADDAHKAVVLLQEDGDSLKQTELFNLASYWPTGSRGGVGSAVGDIDGDTYMDYILVPAWYNQCFHFPLLTAG